MRPVQVRERSLSSTPIERVLRIGRADVGEGEDLARVVDCLAPGVGSGYVERILQEASCVARLHGMVVRMRAVVSDSDAGRTELPSIACRLIHKWRGWIIHAGLENSARRQQVCERRENVTRPAKGLKIDSLHQRPDEEVVVDVLEQTNTPCADIPDLEDVAAINLSLNTQRELLGIRRVEIRRHLGLRQISRIQFD